MKRISELICFIILGFLIWGICEAQMLVVKRYGIENSQLTGLRIVFLADFHYQPGIKPKIERMIKLVNKLQPDLIILGGDYVQNRKYVAALFNMLEKLEAPLGIYWVRGNHDYDNLYNLVEIEANQVGFKSLNHQLYSLTYNENHLILVGVPDLTQEKVMLSNLLSSVKENAYSILISHQPDLVMILDKLSREKLDLMLSGHTHGGQINLFGYAPYLPSQYGRQHKTGRKNFLGMDIIITNGIGEQHLPFRFLAPPQIVVLEFI